MADDLSMNQLQRTAQERMRQIQQLIVELHAINPLVSPAKARAAMDAAADELEQLIGGPNE